MTLAVIIVAFVPIAEAVCVVFAGLHAVSATGSKTTIKSAVRAFIAARIGITLIFDAVPVLPA